MTSDAACWFAAYGPDLLRAHLLARMRGRAVPMSVKAAAACTDPTEPAVDRAVFIPYALRFAGVSKDHGGPAAALAAQRDETVQTLGRLWLLKPAQVLHLLRQDAGDPELALDLSALAAAGVQELAGVRLLHLGQRDGHPMLTWTPRIVDPVAPPAHPYLSALVAGLIETYALNMQGVRKYLLKTPGIAGVWDGRPINDAYRSAEDLLASS